MNLNNNYDKYNINNNTIDTSSIHLIEKTLPLEKYKPWTMGPNGFMGTTLLAFANLKFFSEMFTFTKLFAMLHFKKRKTVSSIYGSQLHQCWTHKRFLQLKSEAIYR